MNKFIGKGILLGVYFVICDFFFRAFWPYLKTIWSSFPDILNGTVAVPELPEKLVVALILFAAFNVVFFSQIFQILDRKDQSKDHNEDDK